MLGDVGRNHGTGFLRDPRRFNVLVTRARESLILVLSDAVGRTARSGTGHDYFHHIRSVCTRLRVIWHVESTIGDVHGLKDSAHGILQHMRKAPPISHEQVCDAFAPQLLFFFGLHAEVLRCFGQSDGYSGFRRRIGRA